VIVYSLRCENSHEFDGWFRSGAAFDAEVSAGEHVCPTCGSTKVEKAPMAPAVGGAKMSAPPGCPMAAQNQAPPCAGGCGCFPE
jgi:hypothetical protein